MIKPGEKVPLDGEVIEGQSIMDTSALTGEFVPREVTKGCTVLGGFINKNGVISAKATLGVVSNRIVMTRYIEIRNARNKYPISNN